MAKTVLSNQTAQALAVAGYLIGVLSLSSCLSSCKSDYQPERLPGISKTAVWAGAEDGGAWIECSLDEEKSANWCTVWDDQLGRVVARTHYVLRDTGSPVPEEDLRFLGFTGTYIILADDRLLEPQAFHGVDVEDFTASPIEPPRSR